jgi:hypothetical protein
MIAGKGSLIIELEGVQPVRWRSFLNAELLGPVRVVAAVDLHNCVTVGSPSGAGVLVILPEEEQGDVCHDFCFLVEPSEPPHLQVIKSAKRSDLSNEWTYLHSESLPHCSGQQEVWVEVTVLDNIMTVSTNSVPSAWALNVPTSGGPQGLRAFGLCGIGPRRISWNSFQVYVSQDQPIPNNTSAIPGEDLPHNFDRDTVSPCHLSCDRKNTHAIFPIHFAVSASSQGEKLHLEEEPIVTPPLPAVLDSRKRSTASVIPACHFVSILALLN